MEPKLKVCNLKAGTSTMSQKNGAGCWLEVTGAFDCINDDSMLLETAVGKTFGTPVLRIDVRILSAIVVDMDTSEGFPKDRVSTAIFEEVIGMVLPLASKDCVLLADPK